MSLSLTDTGGTGGTGRTAWARNLAAPVRELPEHRDRRRGGAARRDGARAAVGELAVAGLLRVGLDDRALDPARRARASRMDLREWVNEGLMTFFFLVVGLEAKRELDLGAAARAPADRAPGVRRARRHGGAGAIYLAFNAGGAGRARLGRRDVDRHGASRSACSPSLRRERTRLRVRLLTLAVVDDLVALIVIATAYTEHVSLVPLADRGRRSSASCSRCATRRSAGAGRSPRSSASASGSRCYKSGIDPVIAGLAVGLVTSAYPPARTDLERVTELTRSFREQPTPAARPLGAARRGVGDLAQRAAPVPPAPVDELRDRAAVRARQRRHPRRRPLLGDAVTSPITLGIFFGYVLGKPLGIIGASWLASRARPPDRAVAQLAGDRRAAASSPGSASRSRC